MILAASLAAALLIGAVPAWADSAAPVRSDIPFRRFIHAEARWVSTYREVVDAHNRFLFGLEEAAQTAWAFHDARDAKGGAAWAETWAAEAKGKLERLRASRAGLRSEPPALKGDDYDLRQDAEAKALFDATAGLPAAVSLRLREFDEAAEEAIALTVGTAGGNTDEAERLSPAGLAALVVGLRLDSDLLSAFMPVVTADGTPKNDVMAGGIAWNRARIAMLDFGRRALAGEAYDRRSTAESLRAEAAAVQGASDRLRARVDAALLPGAPPRMPDWSPACYREDQADLSHLAGAIRDIATAVEARVEPDLPALLQFQEAGQAIADRIGERYCPNREAA